MVPYGFPLELPTVMVVSPFNLVLLGAVHLFLEASRALLKRMIKTTTSRTRIRMNIALIPMTNSPRTGVSVLETPVTSSVMGFEILFEPARGVVNKKRGFFS